MVESYKDTRIRLAFSHRHLRRNGFWPEAILRRRSLSLSVGVLAVVRSGSCRRLLKVRLAEVVQLDKSKLRLIVVDGIINARLDADLDLSGSLRSVVLLSLLVRLFCLLESFLVGLSGFSTRVVGLEHNTGLSECNTTYGSVDVLDEVSGQEEILLPLHEEVQTEVANVLRIHQELDGIIKRGLDSAVQLSEVLVGRQLTDLVRERTAIGKQ